MEKILLYGLSDESADRIQDALAEIGIPVYVIGDDGLTETVAELFELEDDLDTRAEAFDGEYMIMQDIDTRRLYEVLNLIEKDGYEFDGIKIMRTDVNENWTLKRLLTETAEEHRLHKKALILREVLAACNSLDLSGMPDDEKEKFKQNIMDAFMVLYSGSYTENELDKYISGITESLKKTRKIYN